MELTVEEDGLLQPQAPFSRLSHEPLANALINKRTNAETSEEGTLGKIGVITFEEIRTYKISISILVTCFRNWIADYHTCSKI